MRSHDYRWIGLPLLCLSIAAVLAADGEVNLGQSSIVATFKQQHAPVEAAFKRFSGSIAYDAAKPAATVANLSVDMNSLDIGDADSDAEVRKPAWFDSARYPLSEIALAMQTIDKERDKNIKTMIHIRPQ